MISQQTNHTWCKICGITSVDDTVACAALGVDAVGFNCYEQSSRYVELAQLVDLAASIDVTRVALFVDADRANVEAVLAAAQIDLLQFHGGESPDFCASFGLPYIKVLRMQSGTDVPAMAIAYASAWALLLDTFVPGRPGGTGQQFDWSLWPKDCKSRLILAGGLDPENVAGAVAQLSPFGVDVCGGVEGRQKGQKDLHKVSQFIKEVSSVSGR